MSKTLINDFISFQPADLDAGQVFSGKPSGTMVRGYAAPSAYSPAIDHGYIFHESSRDIVVWFVSPQGVNEPLYVFGPTGCGKTSCIKQLAANPVAIAAAETAAQIQKDFSGGKVLPFKKASE